MLQRKSVKVAHKSLAKTLFGSCSMALKRVTQKLLPWSVKKSTFSIILKLERVGRVWQLFKRLSKTNPRVNIVRAYEDGDFVFAHTEYDFSTRNIGFEIFRFEGNVAVEHWDNIQPRQGPNASGRSMVDGPTESKDIDLTETNKKLVRSFVMEVLIGRSQENLHLYLSEKRGLLQHSPEMIDGIAAFRSRFHEAPLGKRQAVQYDHLHRVLAEGNFVLKVCEGIRDGVHTSFFDLYRVDNGSIVEHWDTVEAVPPRSSWKNENGKFLGLKLGAESKD